MISAAIVTGCDAIHPGYGFLSEDEGFAEVVRAHDLTFIGPPPNVLDRFANKESTRRLLGSLACRRSRARTASSATTPTRSRRASGSATRVLIKPPGRGRRQGHADGPDPARARGVPQGLPLRGARRVRRRLALPRALARRQPPRRGPGGGRPLRARRPPRRARLLRPAPPPEDPRGGAHARARPRRRGTTSAPGRSGRSWRPATRTSGRSSSSSTRRQLLLHRDQLPDPGRASRDRDAHRDRPRRDPDPDRGRRAARVQPGRRRSAAATRSSSGSTPRTRSTSSGRPPASSSATSRRAARVSGWTRTCIAGYEVPPFYDSLLGKLIVWGPEPPGGDRTGPRRPGRAHRRRPRHERPDPPGDPRQRGLPRRPDDHEPARSGRVVSVPPAAVGRPRET